METGVFYGLAAKTLFQFNHTYDIYILILCLMFVLMFLSLSPSSSGRTP